jgi:2,5-diamino-6-(ribosylamino)-4(3H)-pyrimidinone 5'-phosphate reductase
MPDMELHYRLAGKYAPDANLIGSETIIAGQEMFGGGIPVEEEKDFEVPLRDPGLPWWVVVDSGGRLNDAPYMPQVEYCKDVIVLVSESTPEAYLKYIEEKLLVY